MENAQPLVSMLDEARQAMEQPYQAYETAQSPQARAHALADYLAEVEAYEILLADLLLPQLNDKVQDADFLAEEIEDSRVLQRTAQKIELQQGAPERADAIQVLHELLLVQAGEINDRLLPALQEVALDYQQLAHDWAAHRVRLRELRTADLGPDQSSEDQA